MGGGTPSTYNKKYWNGQIQWFTPTEINKKYIDKSNRTITNEGLNNSSAKLLPKGSILLTTRATLGQVSILLNEATTNQGFQSLIANKNINNEFLYYLKNRFINKLIKKSFGSTFLEISKSNVESLEITIPTSKNEQNEIANFLSLLDKKIELQTKKIEVLKIYKSCQLNQIFISNNLSECFLKDLAVIKKGQQINSDKLLKNGNYYMLNGGITLSGYLNEYNTENNTISISEGGNSCGYVNYNYQNFWSGGHCYTLTPININNEYLYHLLKNSEKLI
ncbi:MAG: restriction endonuclease subunit S, partial [Lachnospiraceae bacterium]